MTLKHKVFILICTLDLHISFAKSSENDGQQKTPSGREFGYFRQKNQNNTKLLNGLLKGEQDLRNLTMNDNELHLENMKYFSLLKVSNISNHKIPLNESNRGELPNYKIKENFSDLTTVNKEIDINLSANTDNSSEYSTVIIELDVTTPYNEIIMSKEGANDSKTLVTNTENYSTVTKIEAIDYKDKSSTVPNREVNNFDEISSVVPKKGVINPDKISSVVPKKGVFNPDEISSAAPKYRVINSDEKSSVVPKKGVINPDEKSSVVPKKGVINPDEKSSVVPKKGVVNPDEKSSVVPKKGVVNPDEKSSVVPKKGVINPDEKSSVVPKKGVINPDEKSPVVPKKGVITPEEKSSIVPKKGVPTPEVKSSIVPKKGVTFPADLIYSSEEEMLNSDKLSSINEDNELTKSKTIANNNLSVAIINSTSRHQKPSATIDENVEFNKENESNSISVFSLITAILFVVSILVGTALCGYRELKAVWAHRHYSKMDFLVDGMYDMQ